MEWSNNSEEEASVRTRMGQAAILTEITGRLCFQINGPNEDGRTDNYVSIYILPSLPVIPSLHTYYIICICCLIITITKRPPLTPSYQYVPNNCRSHTFHEKLSNIFKTFY